MRKDITIDGLSKTTYMKDDMEGKIVTKEEVNINWGFMPSGSSPKKNRRKNEL